tara:strand:+ start:471 stop:965 length:495 start_codon:yes stop_codon:yes gene_type:complete
MAIDKIQSESINLADNFAFTGTVSGTGANTPSFSVVMQANTFNLPQNSYTKVVWDTEQFDTNNAFASGRFTVPSGENGKYFFTSSVTMHNTLAEINMYLYKNGSEFLRGGAINANDNSTQTVTGVIDLAVGNYVEIYVRQNIATNHVDGGSKNSFFQGYKLIGV